MKTPKKPKTSKSTEVCGVAIGDLHLDKLKSLIPNINHIVIDFARGILQEALESGCHIAVFLGDVFNYMNATEESQRLLLGLLVDFKDCGMEIVVLEGNHGYKRNGTGSLSTLSMLEEFNLLNVHFVTSPKCIVINEVPLVFMPHPYTSLKDVFKSGESSYNLIVESGLCDALEYDQADSLGADLDSMLYQSIAFGHFSRKGSIHDNGIKSTDGVAYEKGYDCAYYINGHLHTPQILQHVKNGSSTIYPGTYYQTSFGESADKGYGLFKAQMVDGKVKLKYKQVEVEPPILLKTIVARSAKDLPKVDPKKRIWYKISMLEDFDIPKEYIANPKVTFDNTKSGKPRSLPLSEDGTVESMDFDLDSSLIEYLQNEGFEDSDLRIAKKLMKTAKSDLGY